MLGLFVGKLRGFKLGFFVGFKAWKYNWILCRGCAVWKYNWILKNKKHTTVSPKKKKIIKKIKKDCVMIVGNCVMVPCLDF